MTKNTFVYVHICLQLFKALFAMYTKVAFYSYCELNYQYYQGETDRVASWWQLVFVRKGKMARGFSFQKITGRTAGLNYGRPYVSQVLIIFYYFSPKNSSPYNSFSPTISSMSILPIYFHSLTNYFLSFFNLKKIIQYLYYHNTYYYHVTGLKRD